MYRSLIHIPSLSSRCRYLRNITKTGGVVIVNSERAAHLVLDRGHHFPVRVVDHPQLGYLPIAHALPHPLPWCGGPVSGQFRGLPPLRTFYLRCVRVLVVFTWPTTPFILTPLAPDRLPVNTSGQRLNSDIAAHGIGEERGGHIGPPP